MICIPLVAASNARMLEKIVAADRQPADLLELRLDTLREPPDLPRLLAESKLPVIITCRAAREGGEFSGEEEARLAILQRAVQLGAAYVDIEADAVHKIERIGPTKIIASRHDFTKTPDNLADLVADMEKLPCDIVKFAVKANSLNDNLKIFSVMQNCRKPVIGLGMGELGEMSRVLYARFGGFLTFGSLAAGEESAPGQLSCRDLAELYRVKNITTKTALYAVIGDPIAHSMSPEIHNTAFREKKLDAVYLKLRVHDFDSFLREVAEPLNLRGISVTIPHKHSALKAADPVHALARDIGAVNTLTRTPDGWSGDNTDCAGALDAIRQAARKNRITLEGRPALLLGAGGTARAVGFGLKNEGCKLVVANRTREKAEALAADLGCETIDWKKTHLSKYAVVANTSAVGMHPNPDATPIDPAVFNAETVAFDAVYNPRETRMLREARERGAKIADGVAMFVGQAARQFETWTGLPAPREIMERIVVERLNTDK
jgi:3-dehydroquinate dehydratase/shikimate dehydrogenase